MHAPLRVGYTAHPLMGNDPCEFGGTSPSLRGRFGGVPRAVLPSVLGSLPRCSSLSSSYTEFR
eukprot:15468158-Alexandrium_andersonii.AAC.1